MNTDSIQIQAQIRRNAVEQNEALRDLSSWEEDMKKREYEHVQFNTNSNTNINTNTNTNTNTSNERDPRSTGSASNTEVASVNVNVPAAMRGKSSMILRTTDGAGDDDRNDNHTKSSLHPKRKPVTVPLPAARTDADADASESEGNNVNGNGNVNDNNHASMPPNAMMEEQERQRGNDFYNTRKYEEALKCYTKCIVLNPKSVAAYSNRAMVHLKQKDWINAESDATSALMHDPTHVKSYQRRSAARMSLGKVRASLYDLHLAQQAALALASAFVAATSTSEGANGSDNCGGDSDGISSQKKKKMMMMMNKPMVIDTTRVESALRDVVRKAPKRKISIQFVDKTKEEAERRENACMNVPTNDVKSAAATTATAAAAVADKGESRSHHNSTKRFQDSSLLTSLSPLPPFATTTEATAMPSPSEAVSSSAVIASSTLECTTQQQASSPSASSTPSSHVEKVTSVPSQSSPWPSPPPPSSSFGVSSIIKPIHKMRSWCELEQQWNSLSDSNNVDCTYYSAQRQKVTYLQQNQKAAPRAISNLYKHGMESSDMLLDLVLHCNEMMKGDSDSNGNGNDNNGNGNGNGNGNNGMKHKCHHGYKILKALSEIPSIDMLVMMMNSTDRSIFSQCVGEICSSSSTVAAAAAAAIPSRFGL